ncbi:hypothetical protein [Solitalea koreensis]|uniref:DUF3298 domain-containing protein n=1 Tax=Solitalea koreensis TaxID=543615 RepID=A0A521CJN0_9SPHI|nr:hypothetical protein [Solitalea koreensis]SMO59657.1 hypothetical protein SAMN06265350_104141 [Solitalea koreensis]
MRSFLLLFVIVCCAANALAQVPKAPPRSIKDLNPDTVLNFKMDSDVVVLGKAGLSEQDFIDEILNDSVFYQGFKNIKHYSFTAENDVITYDKKWKREAHIYKKLYHDNSGPSYRRKVIDELDSGNVFKRNGKYQLYTVQMFSYIFENMSSSEFTNEDPAKGQKDEEGYKEKLKTLIFSPGKPISGVPFISHKTAIFEPEMRKYYDYHFFSGTYMGDIPVYRFKCTAKPEYINSDKVMIKELTTIFDKRNFQILGRYIDMKYDNFAFSFDVRMNIEMNYFDYGLLPVRITYKGNWDIPFKKAEFASFVINHLGYKK